MSAFGRITSCRTHAGLHVRRQAGFAFLDRRVPDFRLRPKRRATYSIIQSKQTSRSNSIERPPRSVAL
jgi:hypothetical protein